MKLNLIIVVIVLFFSNCKQNRTEDMANEVCDCLNSAYSNKNRHKMYQELDDCFKINAKNLNLIKQNAIEKDLDDKYINEESEKYLTLIKKCSNTMSNH